MQMEHPIQGLMKTAMENIKEMVDVNTIVGDAVETTDGQIIIPISKVGFGFASGGSDWRTQPSQDATMFKNAESKESTMPFGGGAGGGISITPIAFLIVGNGGVQLMPLDRSSHLWDRLMEEAPKWIDKVSAMLPARTQSMPQ